MQEIALGFDLILQFRSQLGRLPELDVCSVVLEHRKHPGYEMIDQVTVKRPDAEIGRIKGNGNFRARRDDNSIAQWSGNLLAVNLYDFEVVTVQMHRMGHAGAVGENDLHALASADIERIAIWIGGAVDRPNVRLHISAKRYGERAIGTSRCEGARGAKPLFLNASNRFRSV